MVDTTSIANTASSAVGTIAVVVMWIIIIIGILAIIGVLFWMMSYRKRKVILYKQVANGWQMKEYAAKEYVDKKDDAKKWRLRRFKRTTMQPPPWCMFIDDRKREVAQGAIIDDNIVWIKVNMNFTEDKLKSIDFDPLKAEDKTALVHELRQAESYKRKRMIDILTGAAPVLAIILILVIFMIFYAQVVEPTVTIGNQNVQTIQKTGELVEKLDVLINDKQILTEQQAIDSGRPVEPPN